MSDLRLDNVGLRYSGQTDWAVSRVSFALAGGSLGVLLGASGSGKTTLLRLIAGLVQPETGDIRLEGRSILREPAETRGAPVVFQDPLLFPTMSVAENIGFGLRMQGAVRAEIDAAVAHLLSRVRLDGYGSRRPAELSAGQAARVALARALAVAPRLWLLDEPLAALDPRLRADMQDLIADLQASTGTTTLLVTHDQEEAVRLGQQVGFLVAGRLRQWGPPRAFYDRPADRDVAAFFGARNFLPGQVRGTSFHGPLGPLRIAECAPEGPCLLTIRPEAIVFGDGPNARPARITSARYLGTRVELTLVAEGAELIASVPPHTAATVEPGQDITISLPPAHLWAMPTDQ
ncbi:MAG: ABC transporter ATP-binding protein [Pseudomonadota bacterium]